MPPADRAGHLCRGAEPVGTFAPAEQPVTGYDALVVGSSVHLGRWEQAATAFVRHYSPRCSRPPRLTLPQRLFRRTAAGRSLLPEGDFRDRAEVEPRADAIADQLAVTSGQTGEEG